MIIRLQFHDPGELSRRHRWRWKGGSCSGGALLQWHPGIKVPFYSNTQVSDTQWHPGIEKWFWKNLAWTHRALCSSSRNITTRWSSPRKFWCQKRASVWGEPSQSFFVSTFFFWGWVPIVPTKQWLCRDLESEHQRSRIMMMAMFWNRVDTVLWKFHISPQFSRRRKRSTWRSGQLLFSSWSPRYHCNANALAYCSVLSQHISGHWWNSVFLSWTLLLVIWTRSGIFNPSLF